MELPKEKYRDHESNRHKTGSKNNGNNVKIGIIGVGGWGKNHSRVLHDFGVLTSICDMDKSKAKDLAIRYNVNYYSSMDDMINSESLDACLVCTPTKTHYPVSKKLMEKGISATLPGLLQDISQRDARDAGRGIAPLVRCDDARLLDTTGLSVEQAVEQVLEWYAAAHA